MVLTVILNFVGVIFILIALILINKMSNNEKEIYESIIMMHKDIKYYSATVENIMNDFEELIDTSLAKLSVLEKKELNKAVSITEVETNLNKSENKEAIISDQIGKTKNDEMNSNNISRSIIQLKKEGLSTEEIAKKLNKSVREIEIILKIWSKVYKGDM